MATCIRTSPYLYKNSSTHFSEIKYSFSINQVSGTVTYTYVKKFSRARNPAENNSCSRTPLENFLARNFHHRILLCCRYHGLPGWGPWLCRVTPPMEDVVMNQYSYYAVTLVVKIAFVMFILYNDLSAWWLLLLLIL